MTVCVCVQMSQQDQEPLYDFPQPPQPQRRLQRGRGSGSLRSISVLDRLLLTVPVWLQLSINPATALHILQREPPGVRHHTHCVYMIHSNTHTCTHSHPVCLSPDVPGQKVSNVPEKRLVCPSDGRQRPVLRAAVWHQRGAEQ